LGAGLVGASLVVSGACGGPDDGTVKKSPIEEPGPLPGTKPDPGPGSTPPEATPNTGTPDTEEPDTEEPDTHEDDGGTPDTEEPDSGEADGGVPHAEPPDAGEPTVDTGKPQQEFTEDTAEEGGWRFYREAEGAPRDVYGASLDEGGNLWVAGGEEGLFLLRDGGTTFERFGMEHGLQPYGLWKGKVPTGPKKLKVISVTGGPAGMAFVGYEGIDGCESEFYKDPGSFEDPNIFKSGDMDRVELQPNGGLRVIHYDIHSPMHSVPGYGHREKVCTVFRIVWDKQRDYLWIGGNHGFIWAEASWQGGAECQSEEIRAASLWVHTAEDTGEQEERQRCKNGIMEHMHPSIFTPPNSASPKGSLIAGNVKGIALRPDGDVWVGTAIRTTRFKFMTNIKGPYDFEQARKQTDYRSQRANRIDVWPDAISESDPGFNGYTSEMRKDDEVSGLVRMSDGTVWVSSSVWGLAVMDDTGQVLRRFFQGTSDADLTALGRDTYDESLWMGQQSGGLARLRANMLLRYDDALDELSSNPVSDIQFSGTGPSRTLVVGFRSRGGRPGGVGLFTGE